MTHLHLPFAGLILTAAISAGFVAQEATTVNTAVRITGGTFEASGVVQVPSSPSVLFVDDGRNREVFWMEFNPDGSQKSAVTAVPLGADVTDLEGMTFDGEWYYVVGSQSKPTGAEGDGLVRFKFDPKTRRLDHVERVQGLKQWLADHVAELKGTGNQLGDKVLNIEGLAWDAAGRRLLLGLRAPVMDGQALIIPLRIRDASQPLHTSNLTVEGGKAIRVDLGGAGIRSIEYDAPANAFRIITGAGLNKEKRDFRVVQWTGEGQPMREVGRYSSKLKPEGITSVTLSGKSRTVVVFDTSRFAVLD